MIVIMRDAIMPDCCTTCVCSEGYGCGITGTIMTTKEMESRPDWCPLEEVEPCEDAVSRKAVEEMLKNGFPARGMWEIEGDVVKQTVCETLADALMDLERLPSVTPKQPEIIRCKDCKHYDGRPCGIVDWYNTADDFCSRAERRTDEEADIS